MVSIHITTSCEPRALYYLSFLFYSVKLRNFVTHFSLICCRVNTWNQKLLRTRYKCNFPKTATHITRVFTRITNGAQFDRKHDAVGYRRSSLRQLGTPSWPALATGCKKNDLSTKKQGRLNARSAELSDGVAVRS
jgi:hypothetical protein